MPVSSCHPKTNKPLSTSLSPILYLPARSLADSQSLIRFSILDQKPKQTLQFFGGCSIGNFDGQLFVASSSSVYRLKPISVQLQIEVLA